MARPNQLVQMTSERDQMLARLDSRNFAAPIRKIHASIIAHLIGRPQARFRTAWTQSGESVLGMLRTRKRIATPIWLEF